MTSHHDNSKINFLCSLGETWSATPGPRKHPVLAPLSQQSLTQACRSSCLVAISPRSLGPPELSWPSITGSNGQNSPLTSYGAALRWDHLRLWSFGASSSPPPARIDRSIGAYALRSYSDHVPFVQTQHRRGFCDEFSLETDLSSRLWRANCKEIELSWSFRCRKSGFVPGGLGGAGFEARLEAPSSSSSFFAWSL